MSSLDYKLTIIANLHATITGAGLKVKVHISLYSTGRADIQYSTEDINTIYQNYPTARVFGSFFNYRISSIICLHIEQNECMKISYSGFLAKKKKTKYIRLTQLLRTDKEKPWLWNKRPGSLIELKRYFMFGKPRQSSFQSYSWSRTMA